MACVFFYTFEKNKTSMKIRTQKRSAADKFIIEPIQQFMGNSTASSIVLFASAFIAIIIANTPWANDFHHIWEIELGLGFGEHAISKSLHHWINDGLMAVFFFVVGLELKREIIAGELRDPKKAILPIVAAIGGMLFPAIIYLAFNKEGIASNGWGIPMATDIAFVLGIVYLLGKKVPLSLKIFLTALAIVDDIGAVLVIALFYTSQIDYASLFMGMLFIGVMVAGNLLGVRNRVFYFSVGIAGVWLAFLMSGVHATIAAVLSAMVIPASVKVDENEYSEKLGGLLSAFKKENPNNKPTVTDNQMHILESIRSLTKKAQTPLQLLEHSMHPFVAFFVLPIFALSNAGFEISKNIFDIVQTPIFLGTYFGLLGGKVIGVYGVSAILLKLKWVKLPEGMTKLHLLGGGFLAAIGFTMSLFIAGLAFTDYVLLEQAKMGAIFSSLTAGVVGFLIIRRACKIAGCK